MTVFFPKFKLFGFPMCRFLAYLMKIIPECAARTKYDIYILNSADYSINCHFTSNKYKTRLSYEKI